MSSIPASITPAVTPSDAYITRVDRLPTILGRVSWSPIMMGAVCAIGLQFILTVLGIALGASAADVSTASDGTSVRTIGMVAGLWWLITGTISLAVGGMVYGRLSGLPQSLPLMLEAATLWGVVALFGFMVVWSGAGMLSQAASPIGVVTASSLNVSDRAALSTGLAGERDTASGALLPAPDRADALNAEAARRAARTASWWSVVGLVVGLIATLAAATAAAPAVPYAAPRDAGTTPPIN